MTATDDQALATPRVECRRGIKFVVALQRQPDPHRRGTGLIVVYILALARPRRMSA